ncbi:MAG TPA: AAA family ATPase [Polyangiaceae bacterium]|nr:AAA family ATPase [Polyangiaceae bacterium]
MNIEVLFALSILLDGDTRLHVLDAQPRENLSTPQGTLLGRLFQNDPARSELQTLVRDLFGYHFLVDLTTTLSDWNVLLSETPPPPGSEKSVDAEAIRFFGSARHVSSFGDGIRAYLGMLAAAHAVPWKMILLDEPEAFLHPPLMARLGRTLAALASRNHGHVFAATHSSEFVMGCVLSGRPVNVVRLTYRNGRGNARILDSAKLRSLMRDPIVRSANLFAGLFHSASVVTESDADRAYYQEVNQRLLDAGMPGILDAHFVSGYGKPTVHRMFGPLRQAGIPAAGIADLDILKDDGAAWSAWMDAGHVPAATRTSLGQLRGQLFAAFKKKNAQPGDGPAPLELSDLVSLRLFFDAMAKFGIFVVPVGRLEKWRPDIDVDKREWPAAVFDAMKSDPSEPGYVKPPPETLRTLKTSELPTIWQFIQSVAAWLSDDGRLGMPN